MKARTVPGRLTTGAYILHSGLEKWKGGEEQAAGVHGMASNAFPFLKQIPPRRFLKLLAATEIATGTALLAPVVPAALAGTALAGFSGSLLALYWKTPALHRPNSIWPTQAGIGISKDVWMLGIGLSLMAEGVTDRS